MVWTLLLIVTLAAAAWTGELFSRRHRVGQKFLYNHATSPAAFHGLAPDDATPAAWVGDPPAWPAVTIILPGRNEGHVLARTLGSLCRMDYPNYRVVFVDDQSTDDTAAVCAALQAQHSHLAVIHNTQPPPDGWVGKVWAVHQARAHATTPYVLFTDADLEYHPQCLRQMMRLALHRQTDLLSLLPRIQADTLGERLGLMAGMKLITTFFPLTSSNDPGSPAALTAGGFLLFRREAYEAIGRHEAVRQQVIEDIALGRRTKSRGLAVYTVATHDLMHGRMYEGWRDTYRGLKKNAYAGSNYNLLEFAGGALGLLLLGVLVPVYPVVAAVAWHIHPGPLNGAILALAVLALGAMLVDMRRAVRFLGFPAANALLAPLAAAFFLAIYSHSMIDHYFGGAVWSGRRYQPRHVVALARTDDTIDAGEKK